MAVVIIVAVCALTLLALRPFADRGHDETTIADITSKRVRRGLNAAWEQLERRRRHRVQVAFANWRRSSRTAGPDAGEQHANGGGQHGCLDEGSVSTFEAVVAATTVIGALTARLAWANDTNARPTGDAVTAAPALLEIQPMQ
jgi:hypothetical protein